MTNKTPKWYKKSITKKYWTIKSLNSQNLFSSFFLWCTNLLHPFCTCRSNLPGTLLEMTSQIVWHAVAFKTELCNRLYRHWELKEIQCLLPDSVQIPSLPRHNYCHFRLSCYNFEASQGACSWNHPLMTMTLTATPLSLLVVCTQSI